MSNSLLTRTPTIIIDTEITQKHKCDSCGNPAEFFATKLKKMLTFCGHHTRSLEQSLLNQKFNITPDTYKI